MTLAVMDPFAFKDAGTIFINTRQTGGCLFGTGNIQTISTLTSGCQGVKCRFQLCVFIKPDNQFLW